MGEIYQCRLIDAENISAAYRALGQYWTIKDTTVLCHGTTAKGEPCQKYSHDDYCHNHEGQK